MFQLSMWKWYPLRKIQMIPSSLSSLAWTLWIFRRRVSYPTNLGLVSMKWLSKKSIILNTIIFCATEPFRLESQHQCLCFTGTARLVTLFYDSAVIWSNQGNLIVNTQVFSATLVDGSPHLRRQLETPFVFTLYHETSAHSKHHQCVFWDDIGDKWVCYQDICVDLVWFEIHSIEQQNK